MFLYNIYYEKSDQSDKGYNILDKLQHKGTNFN